MRVQVVGITRSMVGSAFDYMLACGHVIADKDFRRWRKGILNEPKSAHCDECKKPLEPLQ